MIVKPQSLRVLKRVKEVEKRFVETMHNHTVLTIAPNYYVSANANFLSHMSQNYL